MPLPIDPLTLALVVEEILPRADSASVETAETCFYCGEHVVYDAVLDEWIGKVDGGCNDAPGNTHEPL